MGRPTSPKANVDRAIARVRAGEQPGDAATAEHISRATLYRYLPPELRDSRGAPVGGKAAKGPRAAPTPGTIHRPGKVAAEPATGTPSASAVPSGDGESLLEILRGELRYARSQRKAAETDAQRRAWSKRIDELVKAVERLEPAAPPSPDLLRQAVLRLAGEVWAILEANLPEKTTGPVDLAA